MSDHNSVRSSINLLEHRPAGAIEWDLPPWTHVLAQSVLPLCIVLDDHLFPVGTSFVISRLGHIASASHNVEEALKSHWNWNRISDRKSRPSDYHLSDIGLAVLHSRVTDSRSQIGEITVWPVEEVQNPSPTDLLFGWPTFRASIPHLSSTLSFELPRVGSKVYCVGYTGMSYPTDGIHIRELRDGHCDLPKELSFKFRVVEATVMQIFTQRFANGFVEGPCFTIDREIAHGMSGGPVINEDGNVCGIISAGAENFFDTPASIISALYPSLLTELGFGARFDLFTIHAKHSMLTLISQGLIRTDGSEQLVGVTMDEDGVYSLGPMIHRERTEFVFDNFVAYQEGRGATRVDGAAWRFLKTE